MGDEYVRRSSKRTRDWPHKNNERPPGPPILRSLREREKAYIHAALTGHAGLLKLTALGDTERARAILKQVTAKNDELMSGGWRFLEPFERNYEAALNRLASTSVESIEFGPYFVTMAQLEGLVYQFRGQLERARASFDSGRVLLERPNDPRILHAPLKRAFDAANSVVDVRVAMSPIHEVLANSFEFQRTEV